LRGTVKFHGKVISQLAPWKKSRLGIGLVRQRDRVFGDLTLGRNLAVAVSTLARQEGRSRLQIVLGQFPWFRTALKREVRTLSGGEQAQVALALVLLKNPVLLLVDELSVGLDRQTARRVADILNDNVKAGGTVMIAEQMYQHVLQSCDRVVALREGRIVWDSPPYDFNLAAQVALFSGSELPKIASGVEHENQCKTGRATTTQRDTEFGRGSDGKA
jgi:branched-chain amino acid transport system ATP-binding protein